MLGVPLILTSFLCTASCTVVLCLMFVWYSTSSWSVYHFADRGSIYLPAYHWSVYTPLSKYVFWVPVSLYSCSVYHSADPLLCLYTYIYLCLPTILLTAGPSTLLLFSLPFYLLLFRLPFYLPLFNQPFGLALFCLSTVQRNTVLLHKPLPPFSLLARRREEQLH